MPPNSTGEDGPCVQVIYGIHSLRFPWTEGNTVGQVRRQVAEVMKIAPDAKPVLDGELAEETTVIGPDQVLMFCRPAGEMG